MRQDKQRVKIIEWHLRQYKTYLVSIKNLGQQLEWILPSCTAQYSTDEGSSGTFNVESKVERAVLDRLESKHALDLRTRIELYSLIVETIDRAISEPLDEIEREFVILRYFERKGMADVAKALGYSEKHLQKMRNRVMDSLLISLENIITLQNRDGSDIFVGV